MLLNTVPSDFLPYAFKLLKESHVNQFLMNLHPEFESGWKAVIDWEISPDLDTCEQEILREKIKLQSQQSITEPKAFVTFTSADTALLTTGGYKVQCFECKAMNM